MSLRQPYLNPLVLLLFGVDDEWDTEEQEDNLRRARQLGVAMRRRGHRVQLVEVRGNHLDHVLSRFPQSGVVVLNWLECIPGREGSEAEVIDVLERFGFPFTGASAAATRLAWDKPRVRKLLAANGVPVPRWALVDAPREIDWDLFPAIVKPAREHCSRGVDRGSVVLDRGELRRRVEYVLETFDQPAIVEDFIDGREYHVPLWGNGPVEMLPPVEMDFSAFRDVHDRLCSYDSKHSPDSAAFRGIRSRIPPRLTATEMRDLESVCRLTYAVTDCRDYARIDVRQRNGVMYVLDVNPNADISSDASIALAARKAGYCYGAMGSRVVEIALARAQNRAPHQ